MLDEMFELASKGWAAARGTAISSTPTLRDFYRDLALLAQRKGWLHFGLLRNRERLCAFEFNISYHGRLYGLKTAYDPAFSSIGPGHVLIWKILDSLFPGPHLIEEFDLGGTDAAYKLRWTSLTRTYSKMHLFNPASHYAQSLFQFECLLRKVQEALPKAQK
ncbi:MAG: GNAT family N-acetyltransferase [Acidobacteriota bacterium]|nr:MAG: GNAT family N-acetyltransferase [Acidobacteriota bacterium]